MYLLRLKKLQRMLIFFNYHVKKTWWNQTDNWKITNCQDVFIPKRSKGTLMGKYFVLDKYFYKMGFQKKKNGLSKSTLESHELRHSPSQVRLSEQKSRVTKEQPSTAQEPVFTSSHLISIAGLLCRLSCAGHVTKESGLVSFSLLPVLPQNTLSNS